jgi:hypothetical protein
MIGATVRAILIAVSVRRNAIINVPGQSIIGVVQLMQVSKLRKELRMDLENLNKADRRLIRRRYREVGGGLLGGASGAAVGALFGGPGGAVVGALIGAAMGGSTAWAADRGAQDAADRDSQLDIDIGVHGPDLGAPNLKHPPVRIGAFSREVSGAGPVEEPVEAEGPIQPPPD